GLLNVLPLLLLALPAGVLADRLDRRKIITATSAASCLLCALLALVTRFHAAIPDAAPLRAVNALLAGAAACVTSGGAAGAVRFDNPALPLVFLLQLLLSVAFVIGNPARAALVPRLVPAPALSNAYRWNSSAFELAVTLGLLLGGLVAAWSFTAVYAFAAVSAAALAAGISGIRLAPGDKPPPGQAAAAPAGASGLFAGVPFIWRQKAVLGAISLDLFAVLFGGVVALLPIYAVEVFSGAAVPFLDGATSHRFVTGLLRAAPALGAAAMAVAGAYLPPFKRPGVALLWTVAGFGASLLVFALSKNLWLSLAALFASGMCDNVSVIIRHTLVQLLTPDRLRGRVSSVNQLFIGCSNDISELRGGLVAARLGAVAAATLGGLCTLLTVAVVAAALPSLRAVPPLDKLKPSGEKKPHDTF
ncbi:MAG: MFS transporter, partial [Opitutaceae bacterium]|nr:MFS transporter [Opitutaceae bacterium]